MLTRQLECALCELALHGHVVCSVVDTVPRHNWSSVLAPTLAGAAAVTQHELDLCTAKADTERELLADKAENDQKALKGTFLWERRSLEVKVNFSSMQRLDRHEMEQPSTHKYTNSRLSSTMCRLRS